MSEKPESGEYSGIDWYNEEQAESPNWTALSDPFQRGYFHGREIAIAFLRDRIRTGRDHAAAIEELAGLTEAALRQLSEGPTK